MTETREEIRKGPRIRLHFDVHQPIELVEMTLAFQGLGYEYQSYLREQAAYADAPFKTTEVKLYIAKIEMNCILAELAPAMPMLAAITPLLGDANTVADFVRNVTSLIEWLKVAGKNKDLSAEEVPYSKRKLSHFRDVVRLVGQNKNGNLGLSALRYQEKTGQDESLVEMSFSDQDCRDATAGAERAIKALDSVERADAEKVLMYLQQTNTEDPKSGGRTGDKAIIGSISKKPLSVYIISEIDRQRVRYVLDDRGHNPLMTGFVVDVNVETDPRGNPKIYRVMRIHDIEYDEAPVADE